MGAGSRTSVPVGRFACAFCAEKNGHLDHSAGSRAAFEIGGPGEAEDLRGNLVSLDGGRGRGGAMAELEII